MQEFDKFASEYGLFVLFLAIYSVMRYGRKNIEKYEKWDRIREKQRKKKRK